MKEEFDESGFETELGGNSAQEVQGRPPTNELRKLHVAHKSHLNFSIYDVTLVHLVQYIAFGRCRPSTNATDNVKLLVAQQMLIKSIRKCFSGKYVITNP